MHFIGIIHLEDNALLRNLSENEESHLCKVPFRLKGKLISCTSNLVERQSFFLLTVLISYLSAWPKNKNFLDSVWEMVAIFSWWSIIGWTTEIIF